MFIANKIMKETLIQVGEKQHCLDDTTRAKGCIGYMLVFNTKKQAEAFAGEGNFTEVLDE